MGLALCFVFETSLFELNCGACLLGKIELGMDSSKTMLFLEVMLFLFDGVVFGVTFLHNRAPETPGFTSFDFELLATKLTFFIRLGGMKSTLEVVFTQNLKN